MNNQLKLFFLILFHSFYYCNPTKLQHITIPNVALTEKISALMLDNSQEASQGMFIISQPGYYLLVDDLCVSPARSNLPIIYINSSNVTLDLGSKSLVLSTSNHTPIPTAIKIAPLVENIAINNGSINGQNIYTSINVGIDSQDNKSITLSNLSITNCALTGIKLTRDENISISKIKAYKSGKIGLFIYQSNSGIIEDSTFNGNKVQNSSSFGILAAESKNFLLNNISASNIVSDGEYAIGMYLGSSSAFICKNIHTDNNSSLGIGLLSVGTYISNCDSCSFESCSANNNFAENYSSSCFGFFFTDESKNNTLKACTAINGKSNGSKTVGIYLEKSSDTRIYKCQTLNNYNKKTSSYGFLSQQGIHNFFKKCKANSNYTNSGAAYGFALENEQRSIIEKCEASGNDGGSDVGYGIALLGTCVQTTITNNKMFTNYGIDRCYGYKDFSTHTTTLLRGNIAFGHGRVFVGGRGHPLDSGNMNFMLSFGSDDDSLNAQFIIKESDWFDFRSFDNIVTDWFNFSIAE